MAISERDGLLQIMRDAHKDAYGFRGSVDYTTWSTEALKAELQYLETVIDEEQTRQNEAEARNWDAWLEAMNKIASESTIQLATAIRWDIEGEDIHGDLGFFCYLRGLSYTKEAAIKAHLNNEIR